MQRRYGEKISHIETIITKGIKFSPLQAGSWIGLVCPINSRSDVYPGIAVGTLKASIFALSRTSVILFIVI